MSLPAIPEPNALTDRARLAELEEQVLAGLPAVTDPNVLSESQRRAAALETYLRGRDGVDIAKGITREIEIRIGQLLGDVERGRPNNSDRDRNYGVAEDDRYLFRRLAEAAAAGRLGDPPRRSSRRYLLELAARRDRQPVEGLRFDVHHCSCADLADWVEIGTVDVIVTDPPYGRAHLEVWRDLAVTATRVLKPGGLVWALSGQMFVPDVLAMLTDGGLTYHWTVAYLTPGNTGQVWGRNVSQFWKPVFLFSNGPYQGPWIYADIVRSERQEGQDHPEGWAQSTNGTTNLVKRASVEGDVVCDPFVGSGTVAYAANELGRHFVGCDTNEELIGRLT